MYILLYFSPITHTQTRHPHALSHRIYAARSPGLTRRDASATRWPLGAVEQGRAPERSEPARRMSVASGRLTGQ